MPDIYSNHLLDDEDNYQRAKPKNYIVNSDMSVSQENGDGPNTVVGAAYYVADQFASFNNAGHTLTANRVELDGYKAARLTATTATANLSGSNQTGSLFQNLESGNVYNLNGKTITISFKIRTNWTGKLSISLLNHDASRTYMSDVDVNSDTRTVSLTLNLESDSILNLDNSNGLQLIIGANNEDTLATSTLDAWQAGAFVTSTTATQWTKTAGNFVEITEVQLTEGDVAPKYQPFTDAVYNVFRYFERLDYDNFGYVGSGQARNADLLQVRIDYSRKRSNNPNVGLSNINDFLIIIGGGSTSVVSIVANQRNQNVFQARY